MPSEIAQPKRLPTFRIASPCDVAWAEMVGDERLRTCRRCDKEVYNLSTLTSREAEALLQRTDGQLCSIFYQRHDGTVMTADCPAMRWRRLRQRTGRALAFAAGALLTSWSALTFRRAEGGTVSRVLTVMATPKPAPPPHPAGGPMRPPRPPDAGHPKPKPAPKPKKK